MDIKKIPIIGDIDFSDPDKRKSSIRICAAAAMVVFVLIAMVVRKQMDAKAQAEALAAQEQAYDPLDIPMGDSKEDIGGKTMTDISRRRGTEGGFAKDFYSEDLLANDPLAALSGEPSGNNIGSNDPLKDAEQDNRPEFVKRRDGSIGKSDVFPESSGHVGSKSVSPERSKPGEAASRAVSAGSSKTTSKNLEDMTFEERRRYLYLQNGLDPDTGEPLPGGPLDPETISQMMSEGGAPGGSSGKGGSKSSKSSSKKSSTGSSKTSSQNASDAAATTAKTETKQQPEESQPSIETSKVQVRRSGGVSAFGMTGSSAGTSISSLGEADEYVSDDPTHPFKVKFAYNEKVSSGQRVTIRLCEDMVVDGILIPENTHLFATCSVGERLELKVSSININGKMYTLNYVAYDNDGAQGLYCPQSEASKAAQQIGETAGQLASQAVQSAITGYPGRIFQAGTQIVNSKKGKTTVSVTAGYSFYLMQGN